MVNFKKRKERKEYVEVLNDLWDIAHERFGPGSKECKDIQWCLSYWEKHGKPTSKISNEDLRKMICGFKIDTLLVMDEPLDMKAGKVKRKSKKEKGKCSTSS